MVFVIGALAFGYVRLGGASLVAAVRDGPCVRNGGTGPFRYVAEECVAIVGAAIVSF